MKPFAGDVRLFTYDAMGLSAERTVLSHASSDVGESMTRKIQYNEK